MVKSSTIALSALAAAALFVSGCNPTTTAATSNCDSNYVDEVLASTITADKTLDATKVYGLDGKVVVTSSSKLTIPAGTKIAGCTAKSFLLIDKGSKIDANGTLAKPIVFTSLLDVKGESGDDRVGEWGGLTLLGGAYTNAGAKTYEASTESYGSATHTDDNQSSGSLKYVVIKHTGFEVETDKELNGLSLAGVGSGTTIENIAIIGGADDGVEMWGGTVNVNGIYVYNAKDDSIDTDLGYNGTVTNAYVVQNLVDATTFDSSGMEFGNDSNSFHTDETNATYPRIVNATIEAKAGGLYLKNDAGGIFNNVLVKKVSTAATSSGDKKYAVVTHRTTDTFDTNATKLEGNVSFWNAALGDTSNIYATGNTKDSNTTHTAAQYWPTNVNLNTFAIDTNGSGTTGATIANIWKGAEGNNTTALK